MVPFILTNSSITFVLEGVAYTIPKDYDSYATILSAINENDEMSLSMMLHKMAAKTSPNGTTVSLDMEWQFKLDKETNEIKLDSPNISL